MLPVTHCGASDESTAVSTLARTPRPRWHCISLTMHSLPINTVGAILVIAHCDLIGLYSTKSGQA